MHIGVLCAPLVGVRELVAYVYVAQPTLGSTKRGIDGGFNHYSLAFSLNIWGVLPTLADVKLLVTETGLRPTAIRPGPSRFALLALLAWERGLRDCESESFRPSRQAPTTIVPADNRFGLVKRDVVERP